MTDYLISSAIRDMEVRLIEFLAQSCFDLIDADFFSVLMDACQGL